MPCESTSSFVKQLGTINDSSGIIETILTSRGFARDESRCGRRGDEGKGAGRQTGGAGLLPGAGVLLFRTRPRRECEGVDQNRGQNRRSGEGRTGKATSALFPRLVRGSAGTPERIRTSDLVLWRQTTNVVFSKGCMWFLDAKWTEPQTLPRGRQFYRNDLLRSGLQVCRGYDLFRQPFQHLRYLLAGSLGVVKGHSARRAPSILSARRLRSFPGPQAWQRCAANRANSATASPASGPTRFEVSLHDCILGKRVSAVAGEHRILRAHPELFVAGVPEVPRQPTEAAARCVAASLLSFNPTRPCGSLLGERPPWALAFVVHDGLRPSG